MAATKSDPAVERSIRQELLAVEYRLTIRMGLMFAAVIAILASLKYFG